MASAKIDQRDCDRGLATTSAVMGHHACKEQQLKCVQEILPLGSKNSECPALLTTAVRRQLGKLSRYYS
ncbi:hypothetical protein C0Q70_17898 [Pomacea canaliculata]|uniref:Uncharacterized protein n=1 Tax=Pomacea canaliculata TaxID=400727 RepID=A0A2T7NLQ1_POMCA|nr:hypothetical protein C0Q70_17898 [Pomacea canaliculata]